MHAKIERYDCALQAATARDALKLPAFRAAFRVPDFLQPPSPRHA